MRFPTNATPTRKVGHRPLQPERWQAPQKLGDFVVQESPERASAAAVHVSVCVSRQGLQIILGSCSVRCPPPFPLSIPMLASHVARNIQAFSSGQQPSHCRLLAGLWHSAQREGQARRVCSNSLSLWVGSLAQAASAMGARRVQG